MDKLEDCVRSRLGDINVEEKLRPVRLLDTRTWPRTNLADFGNDDIQIFIDHYAELVEAQGE